MRTLIYVPIVHAEADMGSMAEELKQRFEAAYGPGKWAARQPSVRAMWQGIRSRVLALPIPWRRARVYQDGLPVCNHEIEIVRDVAAKGSENYALLLELMARGAALMGTEDPALMVREYRRIQALALACRREVTGEELLALKREGEELLRQRDAFIARRVETTLLEGETGILFLGLLHRVDQALGAGFHVEHLIHNLPLREDLERRVEERDRHE